MTKAVFDLTILKKDMPALALHYGLKLVVLFGSRATGKTHAQSDLDVAILPEPELSFSDENHLSSEIARISGIKDVEIVNLKIAGPILLKNIMDSGITLYEKSPSTFSLYRMRAFKMFVESKPLRTIRDLKMHQFLTSH